MARITATVEIGWTIGAPIAKTPMAMRLAKVPVLDRMMLAIPPSTGMVRAMLKGVGLRHAIESGRFGPIEIDWFKSVLRDTDTMRNELRSLPQASESASAFGPDGLIAGTERSERFFFWPMGIASAGAMRQWGRQPTAFVGRRHFDDADLLEKRFELDL